MEKQIKTILGTVEDFVLAKSGKKADGTPWALYKGFISGEKFSTFDEEYVKNNGTKKRYLSEEEPKEFTNKEGKLIQYQSRTLLPFKTAKDHEDSFEEAQKDMPVVEEEPKEPEMEDPREIEEDDPGFGATEEEKDALTKDDSKLDIIHKLCIEILTKLEEK